MPILAHRDLGGEGKPPLVILHGLLGSSRNWQSAGRDLAAQFHVLALDLRNHGDSFHARESGYGELVVDVVAWLDAHGLGAVRLMGHSLGGKVAMRLACRYAERVEKLVVVDIAPKAYPHSHGKDFGAMAALDLATLGSRQEAEERLAANVPDWAMRKFLVTNLARTEPGGWRWVINLPALTAVLPELEGDSLSAGDGYAGEVLFVLGGKSRYFTPGDEARVAPYFPRAEYAWLAESGHNPHFDARERFVDVVRGFLG